MGSNLAWKSVQGQAENRASPVRLKEADPVKLAHAQGRSHTFGYSDAVLAEEQDVAGPLAVLAFAGVGAGVRP